MIRLAGAGPSASLSLILFVCGWIIPFVSEAQTRRATHIVKQIHGPSESKNLLLILYAATKFQIGTFQHFVCFPFLRRVAYVNVDLLMANLWAYDLHGLASDPIIYNTI